ncbi:MAG TPA: hypothetical protein VF128_08935 [Gemmatimonadaceae bacterium]
MKHRAAFVLAICATVLLSGCEAPGSRLLVPPVHLTVVDTRPGVTVSQFSAGSLGDPAGPNKPSAFTIVFDEPIDPASFATGDLSLQTSTASGASIGIVTPTTPGVVYVVQVTATGDGTITLTMADGAFCAAGHVSGSVCDAGFESDAPVYTDNVIRWDQAAPSVTINQGASQADPTSASSVTFDVVFSEEVFGFQDIVLGGTANPTTALVTGGPLSYTVTVSGMSTNGTVTASIAAGVAVDAALNSSVASTSTDNSVTWGGDPTPPQTTIALSPSSPNGNNGWYLGAVGVTIGATDLGGSSVAETRCVLDPTTVPTSFDDLPGAACSVSSVAGDGTHVIYAASIDGAGNKESIQQASLQIDATPPAVTCPTPAPVFAVGSTGNTLSAAVSDGGSGPVNATVSAPAPASTSGQQAVQLTGADRAGNTTQVSCTYLVGYDILGLFGPGASATRKSGTGLPVRAALASSTGVRIDDLAAAALVADCRVKVSISGAQSLGPVCMKYDATLDEFIYNWKLGPGTGPATIEVSVSYSGTTQTTTRRWSIQIVK